jgi:low temperature requirement protein LtrA
MLSLLMWMYGGYAWLTNTVTPNNPGRRGVMIIGMAGFLVVSLGIPHAFGATGWAFGLGYFVVNAVHTGLFVTAGGAGVVRAFRRLGPLNLLAATLVLVGGFAAEEWRLGLWLAALMVQFAAPYLNPIGQFQISPEHFVERHGLLVIVVLGESLIAIGIGAAGLELDPLLVGTAVLGLVVAYLLWWVYFGGTMEPATRALAAVPSHRRSLTAVHAFGWAHLGLFLGIVAFAAGLKKAVAHAGDHLHLPEASVLAGGLALFLASDVVFRRLLRLPQLAHRAVAAVVVLAVIPAAMVSGALGLGVAVVIVSAMIFFEDRARGLSWGDRSAWTAPTPE